MIRFNILGIALFVLIVVLHPRTEGQVIPMVPATPFSPRPLCNYQMALANQACAYLPFIQIPPPAPRAPYDPIPSDDDSTPDPDPMDVHEDDGYPDHDPILDQDDDGGHDQDDYGGHDHDDDSGHDNDDGSGHDHEGGHHHGHAHGRQHHRHHHRHHRHRDTPVEDQCCKWLAQVDDQCVCELLVHLPPFLSRPVHKYSVIIGRACNFTFSCGSGLWK